MRTHLLLLFTVAVLCCARTATADTYRFSQRSETYTELSSSSPLFVTSRFFDTLALGFNFRIAGITGDKLYLFLRGTMSTSGKLIDDTRFEPFSAEHSGGKYSFEIGGTAGDRIAKLQFKDLKFDHDIPGADYANFQVWLFERDQSIEVHIGPNSVLNPDWSYYYQQGGPAIGARGAWLVGDPATAVPDTGGRLTGTPASGTVYRFAPPPTSVQHFPSPQRLSLYPVPACERLHIAGLRDGEGLLITDAGGRVVRSDRARQGGLDITALPPGTYLLQAPSAGMRSGFIKR